MSTSTITGTGWIKLKSADADEYWKVPADRQTEFWAAMRGRLVNHDMVIWASQDWVYIKANRTKRTAP